MKKKLTLLLIILTINSYSQNIRKAMPNFNRKGMKTSILYIPSGISDIRNYKDKTHDALEFIQAYNAISFSDFDSKLLPTKDLEDVKRVTFSKNVVPLALLFAEYETIKPDKINKSAIRKKEDLTTGRLEKGKLAYNKEELFVAAPLMVEKKGLSTSFNLSKNNISNTTNKAISKIEIDFDDKNGFVLINPNKNYDINYTEVGKKNIDFKITLIDGSVKKSSSLINISLSNTEINKLNNQNITGFSSNTTAAPNLSPYGEANYKGWGEFDIFMGNDGILDKPIFIIDGFDPLDSRDINGIYSSLSFNNGNSNQNLGDLVRAKGYDVVILNFPNYVRQEDNTYIHGGADYIERNAMLLVELIKNINGRKIGTAKNVIIGPSMGGLIARYALNYMENQNINHYTRLFLSYDTPHLGANIPIGFQHMFNYLSYGLKTWVGDFSVQSLRPLVDGMLKSPAAKQMLVDHFESHLLSNSNAEFDPSKTNPLPHPFFSIFYNNMKSLTSTGFPTQTRNISMINGSGNRTLSSDKYGNTMLPGRKVLDTKIANVAQSTDAYLEAWYTPSSSLLASVSKVIIDAPFYCFCDINAEGKSQSLGYSDGVDTAPGSLFNITELAGSYAGSDPLVANFIGALQTDYFTFIPSVSAMAYNTTDWFHYMNNQNNTPFVKFYMPNNNQNHITPTTGNIEFALSEIILDNVIPPVDPPVVVTDPIGIWNKGYYRTYLRNQDNFGEVGEWATEFTVSATPGLHGATGYGSFAAGFETLSSGPESTSFGNNTKSTGISATALGHYTNATGSFSTATGYGTKSTAVASFTTALNTNADALGMVSIGVNNTTSTNAVVDDGSYYNKGGKAIGDLKRAFVIGNGEINSNNTPGRASDAFTVFYNGTTVIAGDLTINSDSRLKSNIQSLGNTLSKLVQLDGKSYTLNANPSKKKIGLIAQDVRAVFPELVKKSADVQGTLSVNYLGLIPILINAVKEQQKGLDELKELVKTTMNLKK